MKTIISTAFVIAALFVATAGAASSAACSKCHDPDEFAGMSADDIVGAARDSSIAAHRKLPELSDAQLQAIAAELQRLGSE